MSIIDVFQASYDQLSSEQQELLKGEILKEIRDEFLLIHDIDGDYPITLKKAFGWIGNEQSNYGQAKKDFKEIESMFDQATHEKELFKDYFIKKEGDAEEIYFSIKGFQTFCMSQNKGIRAKAVKKYFIVLQSEYLKAVRAHR